MAAKTDTLAERQRKQKILLGVLGVVLLAIGVFQGPKLLDQLNGSSAAPAPEASASQTGSTATTPAADASGTAGAVTTTAGSAAGPRSAVLVGVAVSGNGRPVAGEGQLRTFSLFTAKDPFEQSLPQETSGATSATGQPTLSDTQPGTGAGGGAGGGGGGQAGSGTAPAGTLQFATIAVNGEAEAVTLKTPFPKDDKLFVVVSLKPKVAKIAVAGGSFTDGKTVTLTMGKSLTLVNTATGARYSVKLLFTGEAPEQVAGFVQGAQTK